MCIHGQQRSTCVAVQLKAFVCSLAFGICVARVARVVMFCKVYTNKIFSWHAFTFAGFGEGCALAQNLRSPPKSS